MPPRRDAAAEPAVLQEVNPPHTNARVLLMRWEENDLGGGPEHSAKQLMEFFKNGFHYIDVEEFKIPMKDFKAATALKLSILEEACKKDKTSLIVYYAGHGGLDSAADYEYFVCAFGGPSHQYPTRDKPWNRGPRLSWNLVQNWLESMDTDVLILLDACGSAGAAALKTEYDSRKRTELIAACGYKSYTFGPTVPRPPRCPRDRYLHEDEIEAEFSKMNINYTNALVDCLQKTTKDDDTFTAVTLHRDLVRNIVKRNFDERTLSDVTRTPVYFSLGSSSTQYSIAFKKGPAPPALTIPEGDRKSLDDFAPKTSPNVGSTRNIPPMEQGEN